MASSYSKNRLAKNILYFYILIAKKYFYIFVCCWTKPDSVLTLGSNNWDLLWLHAS